MLKKLSITICLLILFSINLHAAGTSDGSSSKVKSDYDKAVSLIKSAKEYEKKDKTKKANKRYKKALRIGAIEKKKKCEICGVDNVVLDGHHDDYSKPFLVRWLCKSCHAKQHTKELRMTFL